MRNHINNKKGFTLIELVMVIVILGVLAAVAIPRFVDLKSSATSAVFDGVGAAIRGQITMNHAKYLINSSGYEGTDIAASIDTSGIDSVTASAATGDVTITATIGSDTRAWNYTARSGNTPASIVIAP